MRAIYVQLFQSGTKDATVTFPVVQWADFRGRKEAISLTARYGEWFRTEYGHFYHFQ